jgi:hypothetical protein
MTVFVFEPDLIFSSKFDRLTRLTGIDFKIFTDSTEFVASAQEKPEALIINLDAIKPEMLQIVVDVGVPVMGYYSHVDSDRARTAVQLGVRRVVTRGAFHANSESLVRELLKFRKQGL